MYIHYTVHSYTLTTLTVKYVYRYISCNLLYMYVYERANRAEDK
jgi:hypothetical protein